MVALRVGVIGVGFIGQLHARAVAESEKARLSAVVDASDETGRSTADRYGAAYFSDVDAALSASAADAFIVALPDTRHEAVTCRILETGRAVMVEKPMAHSLRAAQAMARAADAGGRLLVAHTLRFDPRYAAAAAAVREGRIGEPIHAMSGRFTVRDVGVRMNGSSSVCFYLGVHDVDMLQWISGSSVTRVFSRSVSKLMPSLGVQSEDAIFTTCEMTNGMTGQLYFGWTLPSDVPTGIWARTEVVGTEGLVDLDVRNHGLQILSQGRCSLPDGLHWPVVNGRITGDLFEEVRHFIQAVRQDKPFIMPVNDALRAVSVNDAILRSVASGQAETVEPWAL